MQDGGHAREGELGDKDGGVEAQIPLLGLDRGGAFLIGGRKYFEDCGHAVTRPKRMMFRVGRKMVKGRSSTTATTGGGEGGAGNSQRTVRARWI
jgi:hypothetical protein